MKHRKALIIILSLLLVTAGAFFLYAGVYYHAEDGVYDYFALNGSVRMEEKDDYIYFDGPGEGKALVFYPGAKVEYTSYIPLMYETAQKGVDVFLVRMPFNLAFFSLDRADGIIGAYDYESWYIGGHSLGGAMAAYYASSSPGKLSGVVFLASYTTKDLKEKGLRVLSIYGTEDGVLNMDRIESGKSLIPSDSVTVVIDGGNHAYYGFYGEQKGDGMALISRREQIARTSDAVASFILSE